MKRFSALVILCFLILLSPTPAASQQAETHEIITLPLWPEGPAEENGLTGPERSGGCTGNISTATLTIHLPPADKATGKAVVVIPGGGYGVVCDDIEGKQIADILVPMGIAAIVLKYRLPNQHHEIPADDARRAIRTVRYNAAQWRINPDNIGVWGFSAGGHLASTVSTVFDAGQPDANDPIEQQGSRPDFSILFYPVISLDEQIAHGGSRRNLLGSDAPYNLVKQYSSDLRVTENTPPTFMLHAGDDPVVPVSNSLRYYQRLVENNVSARLQIYETGGHGINVFKNNPTWYPVFVDWLDKR